MSIWDQKFHGELPSTTNIDRKIPSEIMANGTTSINPAKEAELLDGEPYVSIRDGKIEVNDGTNNIIVLGQRPDGTYGFLMSQGKDVANASTEELIATSDLNMLKIVDSGVLTIPDPGLASSASDWTFENVFVTTDVVSSVALPMMAFMDFGGSFSKRRPLPYTKSMTDPNVSGGGVETNWWSNNGPNSNDNIEVHASVENFGTSTAVGDTDVYWYLFK